MTSPDDREIQHSPESRSSGLWHVDSGLEWAKVDPIWKQGVLELEVEPESLPRSVVLSAQTVPCLNNALDASVCCHHNMFAKLYYFRAFDVYSGSLLLFFVCLFSFVSFFFFFFFFFWGGGGGVRSVLLLMAGMLLLLSQLLRFIDCYGNNFGVNDI